VTVYVLEVCDQLIVKNPENIGVVVLSLGVVVPKSKIMMIGVVN
jgi:hypothetical protein